jgi:predicted Zn finger-like uncharacterized protein
MANSNLDLFTRCSGCDTVFRVTTSDLQASGGQVRCGRCQTIFDAFASLTARPPGQPQEDPTAISDGSPRSEDAATGASIPAAHETASHDSMSLEPTALDPNPHYAEAPDAASVEAVSNDAVSNEAISNDANSNNAVLNDADSSDPVAQMPMPDQVFEAISAAEVQELEAIAGSQEQAVQPPGEADHFASNLETNLYEWEFKAAPKLPRTKLWLSLSLLLAVTAIAQSAYAFRSHLMVNYPQARPLYVQVCVWLSCEIGLPRLADQLDISASDLQLINPETRNQVEFTALVRNRARVAVEYPAFELTLTNEEERVVARRVFLPTEYLSDATIIDEGFTGRGELAVRLFLDIGPLGAAGYRVYLFYPS